MGHEEWSAADWREGLGDPERAKKAKQHLQEGSQLPGPRANLSLAERFADAFAKEQPDDGAWKRLIEWAQLPEAEAPVNDPREYLPFCAIQALGACYAGAKEERRREIEPLLKAAMNDPRWRMREGVAMAFQRIGEKDFGQLKTWFGEWIGEANSLERRAFVAALAHPPLLKNRENALFCLKLTERILDDLAHGLPASNSEDARVLSKGLEYAISVFVEKAPEEGFALLRKFAVLDDKQLKKIIKSNLGKSRLTKKYADEVEAVGALL